MNRTILIIIGIVCAVIGAAGCVSQQTIPQNTTQSIRITMELTPSNPVVGDDINLKILVENISETPVKIVRIPDDRNGELINWSAWRVEIDGPGGKYSPIPLPVVPPPIRLTDIIELKYGEFFDVMLKLNPAVLHGGHVYYDKIPHLNEKAGDYLVRITYDALDKNMFSSQEEIPQDLFCGPVSSEVLKFRIKAPPEQK